MTNRVNPFRPAKSFLAKNIDCCGKWTRICDAISGSNIDIVLASAAQGHIMRQLSPHKTVQQWCMWNIPGFAEALRNSGKTHISNVPHLFNEMQAFRHRWLDHLAKQFDDGKILNQ